MCGYKHVNDSAISVKLNMTHSSTSLSIIAGVQLNELVSNEAFGVREWYVIADYVS